MIIHWALLGLLTLAAARATHLVADDLFPFGLVRRWLEKPEVERHPGNWTRGDKVRVWLHDGMTCTFCMSIHAGFWAALLALGIDVVDLDGLGGGWSALGGFMVVWFAIAGGIILLEGLVMFLMGSDD